MVAQETNKKDWISIAKFGAIVGVILQHVHGYLYSNEHVGPSVCWAVGLFFMISGYNTLVSYERRKSFQIRGKLFRIFVPYALSVGIYIIKSLHCFDMSVFWNALIHFDAVGPHYFVAGYLQLLLISPVLIGLVKWCEEKNRFFRFCLSWIGIILICCVTTNWTNIVNISTGGGNLFAGPWLFFWFAGMFVGSEKPFCKGKMQLLSLILSTVLLIGWEYFFVIKGYNSNLSYIFGGSQVRMTWANAAEVILLFFWVKNVVEGFEKVSGKFGKAIMRPFVYIGDHTLYVYLYHILFLRVYQNRIDLTGGIYSFLCILFIIAGPIVLEALLNMIVQAMKCILKHVKVE